MDMTMVDIGSTAYVIRSHKYPIAGNICMDMTMVDIGSNGTAYVGDEVVLIGRQGSNTISLEEIAEICDTNCYEILCSFNERIPRIYTESNLSS